MNQLPTPTALLAMQIMSGSAKNASSALDTLSTWMLAGFGAVLGLTISQLQSLAAFLHQDSVRLAGELYMTSILPAFVAKVMSLMLLVSGTGAVEGAELGEKFDAKGLVIDPDQMYTEINQGTQWPLSWFNRKAMRLALTMDVAAMGRLARDRATMQIRLVLLQVLLTAAAGTALVMGIK